MIETVQQIDDRIIQAQANYSSNKEMLERILIFERGYVSKPPKDQNIVVVASGGLDSSIMLDWIINEWNSKLNLLFFRRGARSEKYEEGAFDYFANYYRNKFPDNIGDVIKLDYQIPPHQFKENFPKEFALTIGHPMRNSTMQNLAVMYAVSLNAQYNLDIRIIFSGSVAEDENAPELGLLSLRSQTVNTCINMADWSWQITSPLTDTYLQKRPISKVALVHYAVEKNIPLENTRTCFSSDEIADGTCFACVKRLKAFEDAGIQDPIKYRRLIK